MNKENQNLDTYFLNSKTYDLLKELLYYGVSSISLSTTGSNQQGVRACTSRMRDDLYDVMAERMKAFNEDHPLN